MNDELVGLIVNVPERSLGEVAGELNRRGAWLDKTTLKNGVCFVEARIPKREMQSFKMWPKRITHGEIPS